MKGCLFALLVSFCSLIGGIAIAAPPTDSAPTDVTTKPAATTTGPSTPLRIGASAIDITPPLNMPFPKGESDGGTGILPAAPAAGGIPKFWPKEVDGAAGAADWPKSEPRGICSADTGVWDCAGLVSGA